ncbi:hypothetical protein ACH4MA_02385 [Streptomyces roseolus]|uniref:hypothetical protein n=1 Tax=Streptomyces roseolus TaxID=67358 RepID=UPI00379E51C4
MIDPDRADAIATEVASEATFKVFEAYRKAGFSRRKAIELVKINLAVSLQVDLARRGGRYRPGALVEGARPKSPHAAGTGCNRSSGATLRQRTTTGRDRRP